MNSNTQKLTFGAMIVAVFGVLLLINRQTGSILEEAFLYLFPIPMVAFSARYGLRASLPVLFCMSMISFLFGTFTTIFYAVSGAFIGLVFGVRLNRKRDMTRTLILVMVLSVVANLLSTYALASLMGYDLAGDMTQLQETMNTIMEQTGAGEAVTSMITAEFIRRIFLISMIFLGLIQGFLIFEISLLILRRLRFPVARPKPVSQYYPPKWTGYAGVVLLLVYNYTLIKPLEPPVLQDILQAAGMFGIVYLTVFGILALLLVQRTYFPRPRILGFLVILIAYVVLPQVLFLLGIFYISGNLHERLLQKQAANNK